MTISILNRRLNLDEFRAYVKDYNFGTLPANKLVIHHTWRPTVEEWKGERSINGLKNYYEGKKWPAGPHLFVASDGIWLFSPMRQNGIHAGILNDRSIGIEVVGDYDQAPWTGAIRQYALGVIQILMQKLNLTNNNLHFHRDVSPKSCPGNAITKEWLFGELSQFKFNPALSLSDPVLKAAEQFSAPVPPVSDEEVMIPIWAADAVAFVRKNKLFEVRQAEDVRDAVKFYRLYKLIKDDGAK